MEDWKDLNRIERSNAIKKLIKETLVEYNGELSPIQCLALAYYSWKVDEKPISDLFYMLSEVSTIVDGMAERVKEERERIFWDNVNKYYEEYLKRKENKDDTGRSF